VRDDPVQDEVSLVVLAIALGVLFSRAAVVEKERLERLPQP
jgi:hypothetical protein